MKISSYTSKIRRSAAALCLLASFTLAIVALPSGCGSGAAPPFETDADKTPAEQNLGERIFIDTRFAQFFAANMTGVNTPLVTGDPVVAQVENSYVGPMAGPFAGQSINCRSCHFVTEFEGVAGFGNRTYADFTDHSPIPIPMQNLTKTPRNAIEMVGSMAHTGQLFLHYDGEFVSGADLVKSTFTGRNFGWAPTQYSQAIAHIAQIIRGDNGSNFPSQTYTDSYTYAQMFLGTGLPKQDTIAAQYRIDVTTASDDDVVNAVAAVVSAYIQGLQFKQDEFGRYIASPYDVFLRINHLPVQPNRGESKIAYSQRLLGLLQQLSNPIYVDGTYGSFKYHDQPFQFGATELQGLIIFLRAAAAGASPGQHAGNCAACHQLPDYSDFSFHNTGISQDEYDGVHGAGAFASLFIPTLAERNANYNAYLPATANHPNATETFRHPASASNANYADLGMWNIYLNPDKPNPQSVLQSLICSLADCSQADHGLNATIAMFRTGNLRDLEDSAPYFHNGSRLTFNDVVTFYIQSSNLQHQGLLRNGAPEFANMSLDPSDVTALAAFLKSLTEDYDDA